MPRTFMAIVIGLAAALCASVPAGAGGDFGPKVYVAPGDPTPWRRSDSTDLFRDRPSDYLRQEPRGSIRRRESDLEYRLDRQDSRVRLEGAQGILERSSERDLEIDQQELRSLETQAPNASAVPLLEQQLDRLQRPTDLGQ
jgi:hypothetical protein